MQSAPPSDLQQHLQQRGPPQHPAFNPAMLKNPPAGQRHPGMHHQYPPPPNLGRPPISGPPPHQLRQSPHLPPAVERQPAGGRVALPYRLVII